MTIKCGNCNQDIVVPDDLVIGQHVRCPYCNEKTAFDKPTRIELPTGLFARRRKAIAQQQESVASEPAPSEPAPEKPKLKIHRPNQEKEAAVDLNAEAIKRHMEEAAQGKRVAGARAAAARAAVRRETVYRRAAVLVLLALVTLGIACWIGACSRERTRKRHEMLARLEQQARENARQREVRDEADRKQRLEEEARRKAADEEREKRKHEREQQRLQAQAEREAQQAEAERRKAERKQAADEYARLVAAFQDKQFVLADHRKIADALGKRTDAFYFLLADVGESAPLYVVATATNGVRAVTRICPNAQPEILELDAFVEQMAKSEYLMLHGKQVCFRSLRKNPRLGKMALRKRANPTEAFFGGAYDLVKTLELSFDELTFDVSFEVRLPKKGTKEAAVGSVPFGCEVTEKQVLASLAEAFPLEDEKGRLNVKKFKRKMVYWEGNVVKQGLDGKTYVPRDKGNLTFNRWNALARQVEEEECAEQRYYDEARAALDEKMTGVNAKRREEWRRQMQDALVNGLLVYRVKIADGED